MCACLCVFVCVLVCAFEKLREGACNVFCVHARVFVYAYACASASVQVHVRKSANVILRVEMYAILSACTMCCAYTVHACLFLRAYKRT